MGSGKPQALRRTQASTSQLCYAGQMAFSLSLGCAPADSETILPGLDVKRSPEQALAQRRPLPSNAL